MALIRLPEGTQISGSIGGTTYSHNRYGAYKRNRSIPVNPRTDRQIAIRNYLQWCQDAWLNTLTEEQREAWNLYASNTTWQNKFGDAALLPGPQHFNRTNISRLLAGLTVIDDAPTIFGLPAAETDLEVTASAATGELTVAYDDSADWVSEDGAIQMLYVGRPTNPTVNYFNGPWRYADKIEGASVSPPTSPHTVVAGLVPWPVVEGQRIVVRSRIMRADGRLSDTARSSFLVGA